MEAFLAEISEGKKHEGVTDEGSEFCALTQDAIEITAAASSSSLPVRKRMMDRLSCPHILESSRHSARVIFPPRNQILKVCYFSQEF